MEFLLAALCGFFLGRSIGSRAGGYQPQNASESEVRATLACHFAAPDYHLMNHVTLPIPEGTTQIDHLLVSRSGVFVIETKQYRGWIFANPTASTWTQVFRRGRFRFQNPLHQNHGHVAAVRAALDFLPAEHVIPVVVFTGRPEFKTAMPSGVYDLEGLVGFVQAMRADRLSANRLQFCVGRLETLRLALTEQTDVEHAASVQRRLWYRALRSGGSRGR